jgi:hypothetical protein
MLPRSAKNKGRKLQQEVRQLILDAFPQLEPDDVKCAIMGESGEDIKLSPAARKLFSYSVECKNTEKLNIWNALQQAESNQKEKTMPALFFRRNRSKTYVAIEADQFIQLLKRLNTLDKSE